MTSLAAKIDDIGKPAWIILLILSFWAWWPLGLAFLFFMRWSRRMGCWGHRHDRWNDKIDRLQDKLDRMRARAGEWTRGEPRSNGWADWGAPSSSGNRAFDEYRVETLRRLEEEQREFKDFLDRLRHAKDKAEFDQFMADRRNRPPAPPAAEGEPAR